MVTAVDEKVKPWLNSVRHYQGDHSQYPLHGSTTNASLLALGDIDDEVAAAQDEMDGETAANRFIGSQGKRRSIRRGRGHIRAKCEALRAFHAETKNFLTSVMPGITTQLCACFHSRMEGPVVCPSWSSRP
jgi:hypothetical protein